MKKRAFLYVVLAGCLWGTTGIFVNLMKPFGFSSAQMSAFRGLFSFIIMSLYILISNKKLFVASKKELLLFVCSGISFFCTGTFYFASIQASSVSTAVILMYTAPIFVMTYSVIFLKEKLTKLKLLSVVLMLIGCALVSNIIGGVKFSLLGFVFGLLSGIFYSAYNIITKIQMLNNSNSITASNYTFGFMALTAIIASNPAETVKITLQNPIQIIPLMIIMAVCTSALPYLFYTLALRDLPVGTVASLSVIEPMAATILSVVFLKESLTVSSCIGIVLILTAVVLLSQEKSPT